MNFKYLIFNVLLLLTNGLTSSRVIAQGSMPGVYDVMQTDDTVKMNTQLALLDKADIREKDAYTGTLLMKKSGQVKQGMDKLKMFKKGRQLLEKSIQQDSLNAEYRFLRLLIQENVPDFLNYHSKKQADATLLRQSYKKLSPGLQEAIKNYSQKSKVLKPEDLQK